MTVLLLHGVPETTAVWSPLIDALGRDDVTALALPGFGAPLPDGFDCTMDGYAAWLAAELAGFGPLDLVTHDWGALLMLRVLADRPANVRSWVTDAGDLDPTFEWHDLAKVWQTPGAGEDMMAGMLAASVAERAELLVASGVPASGATTMAEGLDETMSASILALYRSATAIGLEWGPGLDAIRGPGLVLESMNDPFRSHGRARRLGERTGATVAPLPDAGHWWMLDSTAAVAAILSGFWAGLEAG